MVSATNNMVVWVQVGSGTSNPQQIIAHFVIEEATCEIRNPICHEDFAFMSKGNTYFVCHQSPTSLITLAQYVQYFLK